MDSSPLLCASCGVLRAVRKAKCAHCDAPYGEPPLLLPRAEGEHWACLECSFQCRACGFRVPLNHLDMDGGVLCARCGLEQAFDVASWRRALEHAHATTEMLGLDVPGADKEETRLGERQSSITQTHDGATGFRVTVSPGHPLCPRCHAPVSVTTTEAGTTTVACSACKTSDVYALPDAARRMMHGALRGVVAVEHRADRPTVKVEQNPGAIGIACPSCTAPLPASSESKLVTCTFCKVVSRVPDRTWFQISGQEPQVESIWLLFHGVSQQHAALDRNAKREAQKAAKRAHREEARQEREQAQRDAEERAKAQRAARDAETAREVEEERRKVRARARMWLILGVGLVVSAGVVVAIVASR